VEMTRKEMVDGAYSKWMGGGMIMKHRWWRKPMCEACNLFS